MLALSGTSTLHAVIVTAEAFVSILIRAGGALLGAHSVLQHVSIHAQQAVCPQRAFAGITTPVALSAGPGRGVEVVLMGAAVILAFSEQQDLGRVAARRTNSCHVARQALAVTRLTDPVTIVIVTKGTFGSTETRGQQNAVGRAGSTGERPRPTAGFTRRMASDAGSMPAVVALGTVGDAVIAKQPRPRHLTPQTNTADACLQVCCTALTV